MSRGSLLRAGIVLVALGSAAPRPGVLRARALELVDERGDVVGRLRVTERGAELVLGGASQASLVTDGPIAALNLVGAGSTARLIAADDAWLELPVCEPRVGE